MVFFFFFFFFCRCVYARQLRIALLALGVVLAVMNTAFYLAVDRLPCPRWARSSSSAP